MLSDPYPLLSMLPTPNGRPETSVRQAAILSCTELSLDLPVKRLWRHVLWLRTPGNTIPTAASGSFASTLRYAVEVLKVHDLVVCGHSSCSAFETTELPSSYPELDPFLSQVTQRIRSRAAQTRRAKQNVLEQLESLRIHPITAGLVRAGRLHLHGLFFMVENGLLFYFDEDNNDFIPVDEMIHLPY